jgi:hypothetical protein
MKVLNGKVIVRVEKTPKFHGSFVFPEGVRLSTQFAHVMAFDEDHDRARDLSIGLIVLTPHYDGVEFNPLPELKWKEGNYIILPIEDLLAKAVDPKQFDTLPAKPFEFEDDPMEEYHREHDVSVGIGDEKVNYG